MKKRSLILIIVLAVTVALIIGAVVFAAVKCNSGDVNDNDDPQQPVPPVEGEESGLYYWEQNGNEFIIDLFDGNKFVLSLNGETIFDGVYSLVGEDLTLIYTDEGSEERTAARYIDQTIVFSDGETRIVFVRRIEFTVRFMDGEEVIKEVVVLNGKELPPFEPQKDGCVFVGWYLDKELTEPFGGRVTKSCSLYACFEERQEEQTFTVTYDCGEEGLGCFDGEEKVESVKVTFGKPYEFHVPRADERFVFYGWFDGQGNDAVRLTDPNGKGLGIWDTKADMTIYAYWIEAFAFTVDEFCTVSAGPEIDMLSEVDIPNSYVDMPVTRIVDFGECSVVKITLPNTIERISEGAFDKCRDLSYIGSESGFYFSHEGVLFSEENTLFCYPKGRRDERYSVPAFARKIGRLAFESATLKSVDLGNVSEIGYGAFMDCVGFCDVVLPKTLSRIGERAFYGCGITEAIFPESLIEMGKFAFYGSGLRRATFADGILLSALPESVFRASEFLTEVIFGSGNISFIGDYAFADTGLKTIVFPPQVAKTDKNIFDGCRSLSSVTLSEEYRGDLDGFFCELSSLEEIKVPQGNAFYSGDGVLFTKAMDKLLIYPRGKKDEKYVVPRTVTDLGKKVFNGNGYIRRIEFQTGSDIKEIGEETFSECVSLESIVLPDGVISIGTKAFYGCSSLDEVEFGSSLRVIGPLAFAGCALESAEFALGELGESAFEGCSLLREIRIDAEFIGASAFKGCDALVGADLGGTSGIGAFAFEGCTSLCDVASEVVTVGEGAFCGCSSLESINIPLVSRIEKDTFKGCVSLVSGAFMPKYIGESAFEGCALLCDTDLSDGLEVVREHAFKGCASLDIILPASVKDVGREAFVGVKSVKVAEENEFLTIYGGVLYGSNNGKAYSLRYAVANVGETLDILNGVTMIEPYALSGCLTLKEIKFPLGVTDIGDHAFFGCTSLTSVVLPNVSEINESVFEGCTSLARIDIPQSVTNIGNKSFKGCTALVWVEFHGELLVVGSEAFSECGITNLKLPDSVQIVGSGAFARCRKLAEVRLPSSLASIEDELFSECGSLQEVVMPLRLTAIGKRAFCDCVGLSSIVIPRSVAVIGKEAFFGWKSGQTIYMSRKEDDIPRDWAGWKDGCDAAIVYSDN